MLPPGSPSSSARSADFLQPDDGDRELLLDYEYGGIELNDASRGLDYTKWKIQYVKAESNAMKVSYLDGSHMTTVFNTSDEVTEVSLSFDQNMVPIIVYVMLGVTYLRWFDSTLGAITTTIIAGAISPMVSLDDKRLFNQGQSDVILGYLRNKRLYYRQQRDRFLIELDQGAVPTLGTSRLTNLGMSRTNRFQAKIVTKY